MEDVIERASSSALYPCPPPGSQHMGQHSLHFSYGKRSLPQAYTSASRLPPAPLAETYPRHQAPARGTSHTLWS